MYPVHMGQFNGKRICGSPLSVPYLNVTRPDAEGECPDSMRPCSKRTSPQNTICVNQFVSDDQCPIVDIAMTKKDEFEQWKDQLVTDETAVESDKWVHMELND